MLRHLPVLLCGSVPLLALLTSAQSTGGGRVSSVSQAASAPTTQPATSQPAEVTRPDGTVGAPWTEDDWELWLAPAQEGQPQPEYTCKPVD